MEETRAWHSRPGVARALRIAIVVVPIVALFKISLVFPDSAPSRFSTALRTGTVKQLKRKMAAGELETSTPQEAAEQLIGIAAALNAHDRLTRGHTERVRAYSVMIGEEMGLDDHDIELLNWSGLIHDVGKLHVPTEILNKPGRPDDDEWAILKEHPAHGGELIDPLRDFLGDFAESATQHHEKFDGTGYPLGLAGEEITLAGRIVAVADAYDVMTSTRSYKKPMSAEVAREELARNSGTQFDPEVVRAFLNIALGHLRLVAGPLAGLAQLPLPTAATAGAGSAAATGASAAATIAVATVTGLVDPVPPPEEPPAAVALVDVDAPDVAATGTEDELFQLDLRTAVADLGAYFILPGEVEGVALEVSPDGVLSVQPDLNRNGEIVVPYQACIEDQCDGGEITIDFVPVNDRPTSVADAADVDAGATIAVDVLANDVDPEFDPTDNDVAGDARIDSASLALLSPPPTGVARVIDGTIEWIPERNWNGTVGFGYRVCDVDGECASGSVAIQVDPVNDAPDFELIAAVTVSEDAAATTLANFASSVVGGPTDESGQSVSFSVVAADPTLFSTVPSVDAAGTLTFVAAPNTSGETSIVVTATDDGGTANGGVDRRSNSATITIRPINDAPSAALGVNLSVQEDLGDQTRNDWISDVSPGPEDESAQTVTFRVATDRPSLFAVAPQVSDDGTLTFTPAPDAVGAAILDVTALDSGGGSAELGSRTITLLEVNDAPTFSLDGDVTVNEDSGAQSIADFGSAISAGPASERTQSLRFAVTNDNAALFSAPPAIDTDGTLTFTSAPNAFGVADVAVELIDDGGVDLGGADRSSAGFLIVVTSDNGTPVALPDSGDAFRTNEDATLTTGNVLTNDVDEEGPLDGSGIDVVLDVQHGTLVDNGDGTFDYTPDPDFNGNDGFEYRVTDADGATSAPAKVELEILAVNDPPVAQDDSGAGFGTTEDVAFTTPNVTTNDTDIDGSVDPTSVTVVSPPLGGVLTNNGDGTFDYEPTADFNGADAFTYRLLDDGGLQSNTTTVNLVVTAENDPPVAVDDGIDGSIRTNEDTAFVTPDVLANDYDVDDAVDPTSIGVPVSAANGTLTYNGDGTFNYTPDPNFNGVENIQYTIQDPAGERSERATLRIFVDPVNDRPVGAADSGVGYTTSEGTLLTTLDVTDNDTDIDSPIDPTSAAIVATPFNGSLVNNGDGTFDYTPNAFYNGSDAFTYTITDDGGLTSDPITVTLTVTPVNDMPTATDDGGAGFEGDEGVAFTTGDVTANDTDPEDGTVDAASVVVVDDPTNGTLVNNGDGTFGYTPDGDKNGSDSFTYRVADSGGLLSDPATVTLSIAAVNDAPSFTRGPNLSLLVDSGAVTIDDWATNISAGPADESGQTVSFALVPADAAFFSQQPAIDGTGQLTFEVDAGVSGTTTDHDGVAPGADNAPALYNPTQIDTDGDGIGDIADPTPTAAASNGTFSYSSFESGSDLHGSEGVAADFDGDGRLDLALASDTEGVGGYVWLNAAPFDFSSPGSLAPQDDEKTFARTIAAADLEGDGDIDLVVGYSATQNETWLNDGAGNFSRGDRFGGTANTYDLALGDVDGDGDVDVIAANKDEANRIYLNNGTGTFTAGPAFGGSNKSVAIAIDDIDADFDLDVVIGNEDQPNTVWINDGTGNLADSGQALGNEKTREVVLVDMDGDGDVDLVTAEDNDDDSYWTNTGNGTFVDSGQALGRTNTHSVEVGDVDGDGDLDIVYGSDNAESSVWLNDGNEVFTDSGETFSTAGKAEDLVLADFTGDGTLDIVTVRDGERSRFYYGGTD